MNKLMMIAMVAAMGVVGPAWADATIGYSGQLRDSEGKTLPEGQRNPLITFSLYKDGTGGSALWTVTKHVVLNADGLFSTSLSDSDGQNGENAQTLQNVLAENATLYIGLSPNGKDNEIQPRQRIIDTPRAVVATTGADGFTVSGTATISTLKADTVKQKGVDATGKVDYYDLLPRGTIVMWNGNMGAVPTGWALCDGGTYTAPNGEQVTTPNMSGRFPVCIGKSTHGEAEYAYENTGGKQTVKLAAENLPSHRHQYTTFLMNGKISDPECGEIFATVAGQNVETYPITGSSNEPVKYARTGKTTDTNGVEVSNSAIDIRPPFFALAFIMKL